MFRCMPWLVLSALALAAMSAVAQQPFEVRIEGQGPPMILIPGLACSGHVWDETVEHYKDVYECHVFTLAGFAGVPRIDAPMLRSIRDSVARYITVRGWRDPVVMGHSLGGFIAMQLPTQGPRIIVDSYPFAGALMMPDATVERIRPQAELMRKSIALQSREQYRLTQPFVLATMMRDSVRIEQVLAWGLSSDPVAVGDAMVEILTTDLRDSLAASPMLVLGSWIASRPYGGSKERTLATLQAQYQKAAVVEIAVSDSARHFIMFDDRAWMWEQIDGFLSRQVTKN